MKTIDIRCPNGDTLTHRYIGELEGMGERLVIHKEIGNSKALPTITHAATSLRIAVVEMPDYPPGSIGAQVYEKPGAAEVRSRFNEAAGNSAKAVLQRAKAVFELLIIKHGEGVLKSGFASAYQREGVKPVGPVVEGVHKKRDRRPAGSANSITLTDRDGNTVTAHYFGEFLWEGHLFYSAQFPGGWVFALHAGTGLSVSAHGAHKPRTVGDKLKAAENKIVDLASRMGKERMHSEIESAISSGRARPVGTPTYLPRDELSKALMAEH